MATDAADIGFRCLDKALHQFRFRGKDVRLIGEDVRRIGQGDVFQGRRGEAVQVITALVILVERY
jgi:hypothetical protein